MIPTSGTITRSLNRILWMNQTKTHVPKIAVAKAKRVRLHKLEAGINNSASKMPSWAEEIVAPVVGEINLLSCHFVAAHSPQDPPRHTHSYSCTQNCQKPGQPGDEEDPHLLRISIKKICRHNIDDSYK